MYQRVWRCRYVGKETLKEVAIVEKSAVKQCGGPVLVRCLHRPDTVYRWGRSTGLWSYKFSGKRLSFYWSWALAFEFASATICAPTFDSQLEPECTESEGSRKSGSAILLDAQNPVYDEAGA